jgi:hypothetical protein
MRAPTIFDATLSCGNVSRGTVGAPANEEIEGRFGRTDPFGTLLRNRRLWRGCRVPPKSEIGCTPSVHRTNGERTLGVDSGPPITDPSGSQVLDPTTNSAGELIVARWLPAQ